MSAALTSVVPRSMPMTAGTTPGRPSGMGRNVLREQEPAEALEVRADLAIGDAGIRGKGDGPRQDRPPLDEVLGEARLRLAVPVRRPGHLAAVVRDVAQGCRRLRPSRPVAPEPCRGLERVVAQTPPAVRRH